MNALIIANGPLPQRATVRRLAASADLIVCADGGASHARALGIRPHVILGDLDSLTGPARTEFARVPLLRIDDQESTDLEKAILYCLRRRVRTAEIAGALGGRIDHATGSLGCFKRFRGKIRLRFYDRYGVLSLVEGSVSVQSSPGSKISLIPLERCTGVTTRNLLYPLTNGVLELGIREGISNEATGSRVSVSLRRGTLLLYRFT
jgi:thiamine pyrophosphokinase